MSSGTPLFATHHACPDPLGVPVAGDTGTVPGMPPTGVTGIEPGVPPAGVIEEGGGNG